MSSGFATCRFGSNEEHDDDDADDAAAAADRAGRAGVGQLDRKQRLISIEKPFCGRRSFVARPQRHAMELLAGLNGNRLQVAAACYLLPASVVVADAICSN